MDMMITMSVSKLDIYIGQIAVSLRGSWSQSRFRFPS